jgi:cysteinyl-tRNA synthetase
MAGQYLGSGFDIHGGGADLIFPHHENEIAQSEGASGETFARYWLHNGLVNLGGEKMSKSTGLLVDLTEAIERYGGMTLRLFYLRAHYRSPLEFSEELLAAAGAAYQRLHRFVQRTGDLATTPDPELMERFTAAMDDDFSTPSALAVLFDGVAEGNRLLDQDGGAGPLAAAVREMSTVLGIHTDAQTLDGLSEPLAELASAYGVAAGSPQELVEGLLEARRGARVNGDYARSDGIRQALAELGLMVEDTADGSRWIRR